MAATRDKPMSGPGTSKNGEQYFSANPSSPDLRRTLHVHLRGHDADVQVSHGVFSSNRVDLGTSVLLRHAPDPSGQGNLLDLGCGWGPLALAMAFSSPKARVWALDTNTRALSLTQANAVACNLDNIQAVTADQIPADLRFATIWSNPPIRVGKEVLHTLLLDWLPRLEEHGSAYLVVQRNLGADSLIPWLSASLGDAFGVAKYASSKGYRVIEVRRNA